MANIKLVYIEIGGLLYPNSETGLLRYQHEHKPALYIELLLTGKLAEYCKTIDKIAFERLERIQADYFKIHPLLDEDALKCIFIFP